MHFSHFFRHLFECFAWFHFIIAECICVRLWLVKVAMCTYIKKQREKFWFLFRKLCVSVKFAFFSWNYFANCMFWNAHRHLDWSATELSELSQAAANSCVKLDDYKVWSWADLQQGVKRLKYNTIYFQSTGNRGRRNYRSKAKTHTSLWVFFFSLCILDTKLRMHTIM